MILAAAKTRLSLAQMLLNEPDLLLLDEPTNHLDLETTKWLEDYLRYFKGAIVIISHDRYFLDKIVTQIYDVALGDVKRYVGNYENLYSNGIYIIKNECKNMKVNKQK